jgi:hypothetical protein
MVIIRSRKSATAGARHGVTMGTTGKVSVWFTLPSRRRRLPLRVVGSQPKRAEYLRHAVDDGFELCGERMRHRDDRETGSDEPERKKKESPELFALL